jgi:phosphoribosylformylglycinamidine cyclo-ligase
MFWLEAAAKVVDPVLVASADGIGTKVKIASILGRYDALGLDIVNHCVNDIAVQGARPLFFLDYLAFHRADPDVVAILVSGVASACAAVGCALLGGETAEMPDVYPEGEFDMAGFVVGVLGRAEVGANGALEVGDLLLGLPSDGLHTNGYSLARRALPPETWSEFDPALGMTIGEALLVPHRSYLTEIQALIVAGARGFAHITGGGFPDNVDRPLPDELAADIDVTAWERPRIFQRISDAGNIADREMYRVFNMGIGLVAIIPAERLDDALAVAPNAIVIGSVVPRDTEEAVRLVGVDG